MSEANNNSASETYKKTMRLLEERLLRYKAQSDDFLADADDMVDLMSSLGFEMQEFVPPASEMMETDEMDALCVRPHCKHCRYIAVLEKDGCTGLGNNTTPISGGISLMVEQVVGRCLQMTSILNDKGNIQPLKRMQSAGNLTPFKPKHLGDAMRRCGSLPSLSRGATFLVPRSRASSSSTVQAHYNFPLEADIPTADSKRNPVLLVDPDTITAFDDVMKHMTILLDKLRHPHSSHHSEWTRPKPPTVVHTPKSQTWRTLDADAAQQRIDTPRPN